jgi:hypothetical protein
MTKRSATGRPEISAIFREVWEDQIDNHGDACPVCQLEGRTIECNVYVRLLFGTKLLNTCLCCSVPAALDVAERVLDLDVIIEFSGGSRK